MTLSPHTNTHHLHLVQLLDQPLALLHPVDADDDDSSHGDAPEDDSNDRFERGDKVEVWEWPEDDGDEEGGSVPGEGSPGGEERVAGMEEHGDHHHVHGVPVAVPVDLDHPLPEIQVKSW